MGVCHIVSAGDVTVSPEVKEGDLVIACDAGFEKLGGTVPDLFVGDGDSLGYIPDGCEAVKLPVVKDDTDTAAAVKIGLSRGYRSFRLYGALGGRRFSHSIANLTLLSYINDAGGDGVIVDKYCTVRLIPEGGAREIGGCRYFSLFPVGGAAEVEITGAKYPGRAALSPAFPLGVSNEPYEGCAVKVLSGSALLVEETED